MPGWSEGQVTSKGQSLSCSLSMKDRGALIRAKVSGFALVSRDFLSGKKEQFGVRHNSQGTE